MKTFIYINKNTGKLKLTTVNGMAASDSRGLFFEFFDTKNKYELVGVL